MGFYFKRSASFGPFRFNFSKSGFGASVGLKGARLILSPNGTTYITVGQSGFYYRQNLFPSSIGSSQSRSLSPIKAQPSPDDIKTADVEELLESSKGELVESLNKRAQMFNPAIILFVLAGLCIVIGFVDLANGASLGTQPALPDTLASSTSSRQANRMDEYALLVARYGQPSMVTITQAGQVALRTATYDEAHLAITFVPAGCVDAYSFYEIHKSDKIPSRAVRQRHATLASPLCVSPADNASTVVGYYTALGDSVDPGTAERYLVGIGKSVSLPSVKISDVIHATKNLKPMTTSDNTNVGYNKEVLKGEQHRLADEDASRSRDVRSGTAFMASTLLFLVLGVIIHQKNKEKRTTRFIYDLSESASEQQRVLDEALNQLMTLGSIWRVDSQSATSDWKRNAGAAYNIKREQISVHQAVPPRVESNIVPACINLGKVKMFFLPDQILYWQRGIFASIEYGELNFRAASTQFIEDQFQTSDSYQIGSTWRYVRKDGGPDRRFNNNRQLPIMLYGVLTVVSSGGLNLLLHTSNAVAASTFADAFRRFQADRDRLLGEGGQNVSERKATDNWMPSGFCPANVTEAMELLGLRPEANHDQVSKAYRKMAQMYHPDKVAGLGPELQQLAEKRMKEVNTAHQMIKQHREGI